MKYNRITNYFWILNNFHAYSKENDPTTYVFCVAIKFETSHEIGI